MEPLSKIVHSALNEITNDQLSVLPRLAVTALLDDFLYSWLKRLNIQYDFKVLDIARSLFNGQNKILFRVTNTKTVEGIRRRFSEYIKKWHNDDDRVILSLNFDGQRINAEWIEREKYVDHGKVEKPSETGNHKGRKEQFKVIKGGLSK